MPDMTGSHTTERRERSRIAKDAELICRSPAWPLEARLLDVSYSGCRLRLAERRIGVGMTVHFELPGAGPVSGKVVWRRREQVGLQFETELSFEQAVSLGLEEAAEPEPAFGPIEDQQAAPHWLRLRCRVA